MSLRTCSVLLAAIVAQSAFAQSFEVASIRPSSPQSVHGTDGGPGHKDPTRYTARASTLRLLIAIAWNVDYDFQIDSPVALDRQSFDLVANVPEGATKEQFRVMLQNLLKDRLALRMHIESREFPAYELVVAKSGLRMKEAVPGDVAEHPDAPTMSGANWPELAPGQSDMVALNLLSDGYSLVRLKAQQQTLLQLAGMLKTPGPGERPIVDKTGLAGKYNFTLEYTRDQPGSAPDVPSPAPDLNTALQKQLGLQLVPKKLLFDVVVVDSFNKFPAEN